MNYLENIRLAALEHAICAHMATLKPVSEYLNRERKYDGDNLHMREAHFIVSVGTGDGKAMSEIAADLFITPGAASQTAKRLEEKGYITRARDSENYKKVIVKLTEKGVEFWHGHVEHDTYAFEDMDRNFFSQFTREELERFSLFEERILKSFKASDERERKEED